MLSTPRAPRRNAFSLSATEAFRCGDGALFGDEALPGFIQSSRASSASRICGIGVRQAVSGGQPSQPVATPNR